MLSTCKNVFVVKPCYVGRATRFPGGGITLDAIRLAQRHGFIVQTVVKRSTKRQNMFNLDLVTKQHRQTDLDSGVGAPPPCRVEPQFFPKHHPRSEERSVGKECVS